MNVTIDVLLPFCKKQTNKKPLLVDTQRGPLSARINIIFCQRDYNNIVGIKEASWIKAIRVIQIQHQ